MSRIRTEPIADASVWTGADLAGDPSWEYALGADQVAELDAALAEVRRRGLALAEVTSDAFPLPTLGETARRIADDLRSGRGFALLRGFPVEDRPLEDLEILYWGFCSHIGTGLTQNGDASLIHYVTVGELRPSQGRRGVGFPRESKLHIDLTDVVSLLCVRQAPDDPPSRVASSMTVYNELLRRRPEALARLYEGFEWDRMDEHAAGETPTSGYRIPVFSQKDGVVSCQYNRNWINNAAERNGTPLTVEETAIFDLMDEIARETCLEFPFGAGDIQFCNNYNVLHGRAAHAEEPDPDRRRLLMRIWMDLPEIRVFADEALVRYGNGRHGRIGWTAAELLAGRDTGPRKRRADGAVAA